MTNIETVSSEPTDSEGVTRGVVAVQLDYPELTPREREVATLLAVGEPNREIARALGCSVKTIDTHRGHVLRKLHCRNNVDLARLAIRRGYVAA